MKYLFLFGVLLCGAYCFAQNLTVGPSLPSSCTDASVFFATSAPIGWSRCNAGSWELALNATRITSLFNSGTCSGYLKSDGTCGTPSASIPSGLITMIVSGSCPSGFTEVSALNGKMLKGTIAANGDVGTTGGNATITPTGTINAQTFTGSQVTTSAVSAGTPAGTNSTTTTGATSAGTPSGTNAATATSGNCAATNIAAGTGSTTACKATAPNLTIPAETFTGSALATHTHTVPAETFTGSALATHTHTDTAVGTISQANFTGNAIDPSPSYLKVIFCSAN